MAYGSTPYVGMAPEKNGSARCRDGVKVLWCHSHLVWMGLRVPSLYALVSFRKLVVTLKILVF